MPPDDSRNPGARLVALREGLLAVHKALLAIARSDHEREHGPVAGPGACCSFSSTTSTSPGCTP